MSDLIDHATDLVQQQNEEALQRHKEERERHARIAESMTPHDPSKPLHCKECGELIDAARLRAQPCALRCLRCGELEEKRYREQAWMPR